MLGEVPGLTNAMEAALSSEEVRVRQILPGSRNRQLANHRYEVDLSSPEAIRQWHATVCGSGDGAIGAIANFLGLAEPFCRLGTSPEIDPQQLTLWIFNVLKQCETDLKQSGRRGGGRLWNFTALGGRFGLAEPRPLPVAQAASLGLVKTVAREWPEVQVKSFDLDPQMDVQQLAVWLGHELGSNDGLVEIGYSQGKRWTVALDESPLAAQPGPLPLDARSVVLITGGAYGVTAEVAKSLAREARPCLVLVGRSALPEAEPPEQAATNDVATLRKHLLTAMRQNDPDVLPATVERQVQRVLKDRQIRATLAEIEQFGSPVEYHAIDVRDTERFAALIDDIYHRHGRLDGVIHGAGIVEDGLIARKTPESFARVFSTKVAGARVLAERVRGESLRVMVLFSSLAGRIGNAGQSDYAAANEYLNKLACHLNSQWPARVIAVDWGPWDGGMLSEQLRRIYASQGIRCIRPEDGARMLLDELRQPDGPSEIAIVCDPETLAAAARQGPLAPSVPARTAAKEAAR